MKHGRLQCKDIPDRPVLEFVGRCSRKEIALTYLSRGKIVTFHPRATWFGPRESGKPPPANSVLHAMPEGTPEKLALAKARGLLRKGLIDGCSCGCRGDFELTVAGWKAIGEEPPV